MRDTDIRILAPSGLSDTGVFNYRPCDMWFLDQNSLLAALVLFSELGVGYLFTVGLGVLALPHIAVGARWVCKLQKTGVLW